VSIWFYIYPETLVIYNDWMDASMQDLLGVGNLFVGVALFTWAFLSIFYIPFMFLFEMVFGLFSRILSSMRIICLSYHYHVCILFPRLQIRLLHHLSPNHWLVIYMEVMG